MQKPRTSITPFDRSAEELYTAVLATVREDTYTLVEQADDGRTVISATGKTPFSWGHEFAVMVIDGAAPAVELHVMCGGVDGRPSALLDGRKTDKAAARFVADVSGRIAPTTT